MKGIIIALAILLILPSLGFALYGGETVSYNFSSCQSLIVNITNASFGEWSTTPNCTEQSAGNFNCNCVDNWNLSLTPAINSVGLFKVVITNYYSAIPITTQTVTVTSGCGGGTVCSTQSTTITVPTTITIHASTTSTTTSTITTTNTTTIAPPVTFNPYLIDLAGILLGLFLFLIIYLIYRTIKKHLNNKNQKLSDAEENP